MDKEEILKILQAVMQAKTEAGQPVQQAIILHGDDDPIVIDNTQGDEELPN